MPTLKMPVANGSLPVAFLQIAQPSTRLKPNTKSETRRVESIFSNKRNATAVPTAIRHKLVKLGRSRKPKGQPQLVVYDSFDCSRLLCRRVGTVELRLSGCLKHLDFFPIKH